MKTKTLKGFTLAELLIVMAIIVVLAAVAVPTFGKQLETSRETSDMEVIRNAYTDALSFAIQDGADGVLDGYFGPTPATEPDSVTLGAVSHKKGDAGIYKVTLADMSKAKFSQNGSLSGTTATGAWTYVSNLLMGRTVPPVNTAVKTLTFTFVFDTNGDVVLNGSASTDPLFTCGAS